MTRARALKQVIRARGAKTGERYTTARRRVLRALQLTAPRKGRPTDAGSKPVPVVTKGGLSDAKAREKTGYGLDPGISQGKPECVLHSLKNAWVACTNDRPIAAVPHPGTVANVFGSPSSRL